MNTVAWRDRILFSCLWGLTGIFVCFSCSHRTKASSCPPSTQGSWTPTQGPSNGWEMASSRDGRDCYIKWVSCMFFCCRWSLSLTVLRHYQACTIPPSVRSEYWWSPHCVHRAVMRFKHMHGVRAKGQTCAFESSFDLEGSFLPRWAAACALACWNLRQLSAMTRNQVVFIRKENGLKVVVLLQFTVWFV